VRTANDPLDVDKSSKILMVDAAELESAARRGGREDPTRREERYAHSFNENI